MGTSPDRLTVAGLPPLVWERGSGWRCDAVLPAWAGFTPRDTLEQPPGGGPPTTGDVTVSFACPDIYARTPPSAAQVEMFRRFAEGGEAVRDAVLQAAFDEFQDWLADDESVTEELGGPLVEPAQLTKLIALNVITVGADPAHVDLDFSCVWDPEHGFMAVVTGDRVTYVGPR